MGIQAFLVAGSSEVTYNTDKNFNSADCFVCLFDLLLYVHGKKLVMSGQSVS